MKRNIKSLILMALLSVFALNGATAQSKASPIGKWEAYIPLAPTEFQKSVIKITQDSVFMSTDGLNFAPAKSMALRNDTLFYEMNEGSIFLTVENDKKMKGIARWASGQSEIILTKIEGSDFGSKE